MTDKKQAYRQILRTIQWNTTRGNTPATLDLDLEVNMLKEELQEFIDATTEVDRFDALLDLKFVLLGTLGKMGLTPDLIIDGYEAVLLANESKSSTKNAEGKITKPDDFVGPEATLQKILGRR